MKIAMFSDAFMPRINGVSISIDSYTKQLVSQGHEVLVVCPQYIETESDAEFYFSKSQTPFIDEEQVYKIFRVTGIKLVFSKEDRLARLENWFKVKKRVDEFNPDVVHVHSEYFIGYFGLVYAKYRLVPLFYTFHTLWDEYVAGYIPRHYGGDIVKAVSRRMIKFYLKNADILIAPTKRIEQVIRDYKITTPVTLLPTGIPKDFANFTKSSNDTYLEKFFIKYPVLKNKKILLYVGRIAKEKNLDFLYDVYETIQKKETNVSMLFVGGGPYLEELRQNANKRGLSDSVVFTDYVDRTELPYLYSLSTVFVFSSKTETQGLVTIESMLCGTPVVAIGERGTLDVMQGDNGGFMVNDDLIEFSNRVIDLLQNETLYDKKSQEGLEWSKDWTIESFTDQLVSLYESKINR